MASKTSNQKTSQASADAVPFEGLDEHLSEQLAHFELFFKTFGFKRVQGRIWGLLVLAGQPLSSKEVSEGLGLSQGATSTALNALNDWGAISSEFSSGRRCQLHTPVSNTLSIAATVIRRREQVVFGRFKQASAHTLAYVSEHYGERDPRVLTLRSIISSCEIAEAMMQLVVSSVANALDDSESLLHKAFMTALKVGAIVPGKLLIPKARPSAGPAASPQALGTGEANGGSTAAELDESGAGHGNGNGAPALAGGSPTAEEEQRA